jgi:molecular chaperone DnaJ
MKKDYYKILELTEEDKNLPKEEFLTKLSKNFKRLAIKYHPDRNPDNKEAEEKFKEINEANQVLSDYDGKKREYDNPMGNFHFSGNMDMEEILRHFNMNFGSDFGFANFGFSNGYNMPQKGTNIQGCVNISLEDVLNGVEKTIRYNRNKVCSTCQGTGKDSKSKEEKCPHCQGRGAFYQRFNNMTVQSTCPYCGGSGYVLVNPCHTCGGTGFETEVIKKTFKIPAGASDGMVFEFKGLGNDALGDYAVPGDLHVVIREIPHPVFKREGNNLVTTINVSVIDAIIGKKARLTTLNGKTIEITIPRLSEEGKRLVLDGFGLPDVNTGGIGKLICIIHIVMPKKLAEKDVRALEKLSKSPTFKDIA